MAIEIVFTSFDCLIARKMLQQVRLKSLLRFFFLKKIPHKKASSSQSRFKKKAKLTYQKTCLKRKISGRIASSKRRGKQSLMSLLRTF